MAFENLIGYKHRDR